LIDKSKRYAYAEPFIRLKAFLIDAFFMAFPIAMGNMFIFGYSDMKHQPSIYFIIAEVVLIGIVFCIFWVRTGQTPGKKVLGLTVARFGTFKPVSTPRAVLRYFMWVLCWLSLGAGFVLAFVNKNRRTLADVFSGTVVVKELPPKE
jgi:uncharacterized RDD family membrane protein YckC